MNAETKDGDVAVDGANDVVSSTDSGPDGLAMAISSRARTEEFQVFISYRVKPDETLAAELKLLVESAIEPSPRVFVSGVGGLRVSADGYRQQLQNAAQQTKAFIAVVTQASVDREWIVFEAGAAFGRGVIYAPLLIDIAPGDLPSSIGGYQAVVA